MTTTVIFAELLVIGIQTGFWVTLLIASLEPALLGKLDLNALKEWEGLVTAGLFALCYSLGVLVDRLADVFVLVARPSLLIEKSSRLKALQSRLSNLKLEALEGRVLPRETPADPDVPVRLVELALHEGKALE